MVFLVVLRPSCVGWWNQPTGALSGWWRTQC
jgi:hypothetical protein